MHTFKVHEVAGQFQRQQIKVSTSMTKRAASHVPTWSLPRDEAGTGHASVSPTRAPGPRTGGDPHARVHNPPESTPRPSQPNNGPTANGQRPGAAAAVASATAATPQAQVAGGRAPLTHPGEQQQGPGGMGRAGGAGPGAQGSSDDGGPEEEEEQLDPLRRSSTVGWSSPGMELKVANELRVSGQDQSSLRHPCQPGSMWAAWTANHPAGRA